MLPNLTSLRQIAFTPEVWTLESWLGLKTKPKSRAKREYQIVHKIRYNCCELTFNKYAVIFQM